MLVFLFTDIEGSTRLWEEHTGVMTGIIARHDDILRELVTGHSGRITKHTGDGITAVFERGQPLACALQAQVRFAREHWGEIGELHIRVGLHAGEAEFHPSAGTPEGDYFGPPVNCAVRVMSAAWGGQILLTPEVTQVSPLPEQATMLDLGQHLLKNVSAPQQLYQLDHPQLPRHQFPPPRTLSGQSIRQAVDQRGGQLAALDPTSMGVALLSATLLPTLQGELDPESGALEGTLGVLEDLGALSLRGFVAGFTARLRTGDDLSPREPIPTAELLILLQDELQARWLAGGDTALTLRRDASRLLQAVHGVEAAMMAASAEVREAVARGLAALAEQFDEFRWMLADVQDTLAEMKALQRQHLALTEEILQLQREQVRVPRTLSLPEAKEPPAFLEGDEEPPQRPVFVARERELARLDAFLRDAHTGSGKVICVVGGPGRGKTALLTEFARRAMETHPDLLVASGNCNAYSGVGDPYLPFREVMGMLSGDVEAIWRAGQITTQHARRLWAALPLFAQALLARGPDTLGIFVEAERLLARAVTAGPADAPWLATLQETIERWRTLPPEATTQGVEQSHLFEQCTNVLRRVGNSHPLLLILDDMQWADTASLGLLFHLGRRLQGIPILIACAHRPEEVALGRHGERHPLEKVLAEFKRLYGDVRIDLGREDKAEGRGFVDALLDTEPNDLGEGFRRALFEHTGGHPLFAIELLRSLQERGDLVHNERERWTEGPSLSWESLPARVEGVIEERIGRLEEDLREALTVASVEGEEFTAQVVAQVQEVQERRLLRQLSQELEKRHRLVRERGEDRVGRRLLSRYRFAHTLFQQYLYNGLSAGERRLLHGEVANVLEALFEGREEEIAVQLAFHYCRAGMEEEAVPYQIQAGHQARAKFANDEAVGYYSQALDLFPEHSPERFDLLASRAAVYDLVARRDEQRADVEEMLDLAEKLGDDTRLCDALLALAGYRIDTQFLDAHGPGHRALEIARSLGDPLREARALHRLGELDWRRADYRRSQEELEPAIGLFVEAGVPGEAASCLHMLSLALGSLHESGPATEAARRSITLSHKIGDRRQEAIASRRLAIAYMKQDQNAEALPFAQRALRLHREVGDRLEECSALNVLGLIHAHLGEHEEAERYLRQSLRTAKSIEFSTGIVHAATNLMAYYYMRRGEFEGLLRFLDTLLEDASAVGDDWLMAFLRFYQGLALISLGQYDRTVRTMTAAAQRMENLGDLRSARPLAWSGLAQAYLGDYQGSTETLQMAGERALESSRDKTVAVVLVLWGLANLQEGHRQALHAGLEHTREGLNRMPDEEVMWQSVSYEIAAALRLAVGQTDLALACSTKGLQLMELDPSLWWWERTHFTRSRILHALGRDEEANAHLQHARDRVMLVAKRTPDPELRRSWLENVEVNRHILAACAQRGIGHA